MFRSCHMSVIFLTVEEAIQFTIYICHKMAAQGQKYAQLTMTLSPCDSSFFHTHVGVVNLKLASVRFLSQRLVNGFQCT